MLNRGIQFLIKNKLVAYLVIILVTIMGLITAPFELVFNIVPSSPVAVDAIPNIGENQQIVYTDWQGQSPQDIEDQITYPLTSNLLGIPGVKSIRSSSMFGFSTIYIIFDDHIDFYWSRSRVLEKISALPANLLPESVRPKLGPDATALGQIFWYTLEGRNSNGAVTGGWNLQELRSIQDFYVKNALASTQGVSEVASIGGFVKEYQIDVNPDLMKQYGISLKQVVEAIKKSNRETGAQTLEINQVEYFVRGLGFIGSLEDIENTSVVSNNYTSINVKDIAQVTVGPAERRGILDKGGAEVVGGVVTARYGSNPMEVSKALKERVKIISAGLPKKELSDGTISQITIVPFYDRSVLINETLKTLGDALAFEILIAILVVVIMLRNLKVSLLISGLLPLAVLVVFIAMKIFDFEANIVALSGIAIAIGTMVDMGIILTENIVRHQKEHSSESFEKNIINAAKEVSGAILTAGVTTIISFIPVFTLTGAEGKLFTPLAFTKTVALFAAMAIALFAIPPIAAVLLKNKTESTKNPLINVLILTLGIIGILLGSYAAVILILIGILGLLKNYNKLSAEQYQMYSLATTVIFILIALSFYWRPMGYSSNLLLNSLFVIVICVVVLAPIYYFIKSYEAMLRWILAHKAISISIPIVMVFLGFWIMSTTGKEFMPTLDEGDFLLMPSALPHAGIAENNQVLKKLDMAVAAIPEVEYVVGKAGRVDSALDPAPLSMFENLISYKTEYILDQTGKPARFRVDKQGYFVTKSGEKLSNGQAINSSELILDNNGTYYRNWRDHIEGPDDIWNEISKATRLPGITSAPKLQPIETRLVMLQTGMRTPMGIKVKGQNLQDIEQFGLELEKLLKEVEGIAPESVFADRIVGKPYLLMHIDRTNIARYGLSIEDVQQTIETAVGGKILGQTIEGRERYGIRVRYPRELRNEPEQLGSIYITLPNGSTIPLKEMVTIQYEKGPQQIRSEDGFLVGYVIFDKLNDVSEVTAVENAMTFIANKINDGNLLVPEGVNYEFSGTYENHLRSQQTLKFVIPLVLLVIFMVLYLQFRSVSISLMVFSGIAVAFAGGFILLWLYGQTWFMNIDIGSTNIRQLFNMQTINLSVAVWVGFIALFGIATDDGVVMATYLKQSFENRTTTNINEIREAVIEAGKRRIRPCLMTTATTTLALIPILTSSGKGANIMIPMAIPCLGGMLMALITLFVVPLLFSWRKEVILNKSEKI
ncbi:MAG: efflux RND transporter permease subunit [Croceitalea sp.]|nr:efflux RND transporter permease subunit [Croceitalea sp.]